MEAGSMGLFHQAYKWKHAKGKKDMNILAC